MAQITIIIALLAGLVLGDATRGVNPVRNSVSVDSISLDKAGKVEPPQPQAGGGEGGWPAF